LVVEQPAALQERLDIAIGQRQAQHLAARGYRAVAAAVPIDLREQRFSAPRAAGVHDWSLRSGVHVLPTLQIDLASGGAVKAVSSLPPDAVIGIAAYNDEIALAVLGAAQQFGRNVPADFGVIGADNSLIAHITTPTITTIDFDLEFSARHMLRLIVGGEGVLQASDAAAVAGRLRVVEGDSTARTARHG
jgi:DNA-binding LacI/PurR family transcriptional regulator